MQKCPFRIEGINEVVRISKNIPKGKYLCLSFGFNRKRYDGLFLFYVSWKLTTKVMPRDFQGLSIVVCKPVTRKDIQDLFAQLLNDQNFYGKSELMEELEKYILQ